MNKENRKAYSTVAEAAEIMGVTAAYVREILNRAKVDDTIKLKGTKLGKQWRIDTQSIYEYMGIQTSDSDKDAYIKELERQVKYYNGQLDHFKNILNMISTLIISNK